MITRKRGVKRWMPPLGLVCDHKALCTGRSPVRHGASSSASMLALMARHAIAEWVANRHPLTAVRLMPQHGGRFAAGAQGELQADPTCRLGQMTWTASMTGLVEPSSAVRTCDRSLRHFRYVSICAPPRDRCNASSKRSTAMPGIWRPHPERPLGRKPTLAEVIDAAAIEFSDDRYRKIGRSMNIGHTVPVAHPH